MKKLLFSVVACLMIAGAAVAQKQADYQGIIGKAHGAAATCLAGETNFEAAVNDRCPVDGNIVVSFNQYWEPPFCPPGQDCPVYIRPLWDYISLARVTMDCSGNVLNVDCTPIYVGDQQY